MNVMNSSLVYLFILVNIATPGLAQSILTDSNRVGIGIDSFDAIPNDALLYVHGNIRAADSTDLLGIQRIVGSDGLQLSGATTRRSDMEISNLGRVLFNKEVGIGQGLSFIDLNIRNQPGNSTILQVEDTTGRDIFEVNRNGSVGIHRTTNNVTFNVRNTEQGSANNIIMNIERANGDNVLQVQDDRDVVITGDFSVNSGSKNFILDHPLDPANKILAHNAVESPDYVTYYHGTIVLDSEGGAIVHLPDYFDALNSDYHYQLTCIGGFAQVYVAQEIQNNQFHIAGGKSGMKVSWQVSAKRNDPWAHDHPYQVEIDKEGDEKGKYYYPEGYGKDRRFRIGSENGADAKE